MSLTLVTSPQPSDCLEITLRTVIPTRGGSYSKANRHKAVVRYDGSIRDGTPETGVSPPVFHSLVPTVLRLCSSTGDAKWVQLILLSGEG